MYYTAMSWSHYYVSSGFFVFIMDSLIAYLYISVEAAPDFTKLFN